MMPNRIEIPLSKTKMFLMVAGSIVLVVFGIILTISPATFISPFSRNPDLIRLSGIAGILFFGAAAIYGLRKLFDKTLGLIVDDNGITDNTNASSAGLIEWADITEIRTQQIRSTKFILVFTSNPDKYLERAHGLKRKLMQANLMKYGTPLSIISNTLKLSYTEMEKLLNDKLNEQRNTIPNR
jgi:hypothetical protein